MPEENKTQVNEKPDFEKFYAVLKGYAEYCIRNPKNKLSAKEKEGVSENELAKKEQELSAFAKKCEDEKNTFQKSYDNMCKEISEGGILFLSTYVDALKKLYGENEDWKRDIKKILVEPKSLKLFSKAKKNILELYPVLLVVNETFPVDDYAELSLSPKAAMYGSEVNKTAKGSTKKMPMRNEEIQAMLELFLQVKDYKRFGDWFMAILVFDPNQLVDSFKDEYVGIRKNLSSWAYEQINTNDAYKRATMDFLLKNKMLSSLIDAFVAQNASNKKKAELETRIKELEEKNVKEKANHEERCQKQYELIQEGKATIEELNQKIKEFDLCKQNLSSYKAKYDSQVEINEIIVTENKRRIQEIENDYDCIQKELTEAKTQLENLQISHAALEADYSLKNNELQKLKETVSQKEELAKTNLMRELAMGINEQFFYLTKFYLELKDTGKLEPESIELFADTINNIDNVMADMDIKKFGAIDQKVSYDASLHDSTNARIANGEQVIISGFGWKIGEEVYIKAPVEKGE